MNTLQKHSTIALEARLSILFRNHGDLKCQLFELNKLRYQVTQAELSARSASRQAGVDSFSHGVRVPSGFRTPTPIYS